MISYEHDDYDLHLSSRLKQLLCGCGDLVSKRNSLESSRWGLSTAALSEILIRYGATYPKLFASNGVTYRVIV